MPSRCAPSFPASCGRSAKDCCRRSPEKRGWRASRSPCSAWRAARSFPPRSSAGGCAAPWADGPSSGHVHAYGDRMNQHARIAPPPIAFIDLAAQRRRLGRSLDDAISEVLTHCQFVMGPEVEALEAELAAFCGARHAISVASGTDALTLVLLAKDIGPGDAVLCPAFTFAATAEPVALLKATPVFVDVEEETFNLDVSSLARAIATAKDRGLRPKAVIAVDLFGQPADYDAVLKIAAAERLFVIADAAQSFGASYHGRKVGTLAPVTVTSFFPAKPLGCYGDGGAVFTEDDELAR